MRTIISEDYDIEAIDEWCATYGVKADWQPLWLNGAVAGWAADLTRDDHFIFRLRFPREEGGTLPDVAPSSNPVLRSV